MYKVLRVVTRYADSLVREDRDAAVVLDVATGNTGQLVDFLRRRGQLADAVLTAQVACESQMSQVACAGQLSQVTSTSSASTAVINGYDLHSEENIKWVQFK